MKLHFPILLPKSSTHFWVLGGLSFPSWEYTHILINLERLSKPRCRALASATSQEHFIAHKSCSWLIKHCWSEPRNHENVNRSPPPSPLTRVCCSFFKRRVRGVSALNVTLTQTRMLTLLDSGIFCAKKFLFLYFFQNCPWWASCSSAFTLL